MDVLMGLIKIFPYSFTPYGWAVCDGSIIPIYTNTALFALIGTKFGGDGKSTFALPDLRGAEPQPGTRYCIATMGLFPMRS